MHHKISSSAHTCECPMSRVNTCSPPCSWTTRCWQPWSRTGTVTPEWLLRPVATATGCFRNTASPLSPRGLSQREWKREDFEVSADKMGAEINTFCFFQCVQSLFTLALIYRQVCVRHRRDTHTSGEQHVHWSKAKINWQHERRPLKEPSVLDFGVKHPK